MPGKVSVQKEGEVMSDLSVLFDCEERVRRWRAEWENASARMELAKINENCARLISQYEPVDSLGIDREILRILLSYVRHGDLSRLDRDYEELKVKKAKEK